MRRYLRHNGDVVTDCCLISLSLGKLVGDKRKGKSVDNQIDDDVEDIED